MSINHKKNINHCLSIVLLFSVCTSISYSDWDSDCLNICFKTGHDCRYCSYQCYTDNNYQPTPHYSGDSTCLLEEYNSNNYHNENY
jgi:hypothetical protein